GQASKAAAGNRRPSAPALQHQDSGGPVRGAGPGESPGPLHGAGPRQRQLVCCHGSQPVSAHRRTSGICPTHDAEPGAVLAVPTSGGVSSVQSPLLSSRHRQQGGSWSATGVEPGGAVIAVLPVHRERHTYLHPCRRPDDRPHAIGRGGASGGGQHAPADAGLLREPGVPALPGTLPRPGGVPAPAARPALPALPAGVLLAAPAAEPLQRGAQPDPGRQPGAAAAGPRAGHHRGWPPGGPDTRARRQGAQGHAGLQGAAPGTRSQGQGPGGGFCTSISWRALQAPDALVLLLHLDAAAAPPVPLLPGAVSAGGRGSRHLRAAPAPAAPRHADHPRHPEDAGLQVRVLPGRVHGAVGRAHHLDPRAALPLRTTRRQGRRAAAEPRPGRPAQRGRSQGGAAGGALSWALRQLAPRGPGWLGTQTPVGAETVLEQILPQETLPYTQRNRVPGATPEAEQTGSDVDIQLQE
ncbi:hypothetical protein CRUP_017061, partial [Coryphaenoides rupestris]